MTAQSSQGVDRRGRLRPLGDARDKKAGPTGKQERDALKRPYKAREGTIPRFARDKKAGPTTAEILKSQGVQAAPGEMGRTGSAGSGASFCWVRKALTSGRDCVRLRHFSIAAERPEHDSSSEARSGAGGAASPLCTMKDRRARSRLTAPNPGESVLPEKMPPTFS